MSSFPGGTVLDVAIGLVLMYLMLSLIGTTVNEFIATLAKLRAKTLAGALEQILDDETLKDGFYNSGLVASANAAVGGAVIWRRLFGGQARSGADAAAASKGHVSYLASRDFAMAVLGSLKPGEPLPGFGQVQQLITDMPKTKIRDVLLASLATANEDVEKLRDGVASWFDSAMDRVNGAYKRDLQYISLAVGLLVAIAFNADTINVGVKLWGDSNLRSAMVTVATGIQKPAAPAADSGAADSVDKSLEATVASYDKAETVLQPLPIGWSQKGFKTDPLAWASRIAGWLVTGLAISLGAPFWFDLLNTFMNVRGAGQKPKRTAVAKPKPSA